MIDESFLHDGQSLGFTGKLRSRQKHDLTQRINYSVRIQIFYTHPVATHPGNRSKFYKSIAKVFLRKISMRKIIKYGSHMVKHSFLSHSYERCEK